LSSSSYNFSGVSKMSRCAAALPGLLLAALVGCGGTYAPPAGEERSKAASREKVKATAYLFDARIRRHGKPTSFRLEVYQTDSLLALAGRGYLGKGALKGWLTNDSIKVFFPSTDEYLYEAVDALFASSRCAPESAGPGLLAYFQSLPVASEPAEALVVLPVDKDDNEARFVVYREGCAWQLEILYDLKDEGWRVKDFEFSDGDETTLRARRREYKPQAKVAAGKFDIDIQSSARRIRL